MFVFYCFLFGICLLLCCVVLYLSFSLAKFFVIFVVIIIVFSIGVVIFVVHRYYSLRFVISWCHIFFRCCYYYHLLVFVLFPGVLCYFLLILLL